MPWNESQTLVPETGRQKSMNDFRSRKSEQSSVTVKLFRVCGANFSCEFDTTLVSLAQHSRDSMSRPFSRSSPTFRSS